MENTRIQILAEVLAALDDAVVWVPQAYDRLDLCGAKRTVDEKLGRLWPQAQGDADVGHNPGQKAVFVECLSASDANAALDAFAVIVSAPGSTVDFVSRFFAPRAGIPEDPVTGSAHCTLVPYWAGRLGKVKLTAKQLSLRVGELDCELLGDRVAIAGRTVEYLRGEINVPDQSADTKR